MAKYKISVCRYKDGTFQTVIDTILVYSNCKRKETIRLIGSLAIGGGADEDYVKRRVKKMKKYHDIHLCWIPIDNLHGYLGPGAYVIEKEES